MFLIDDDIAYKDYKNYLESSPEILSVKGNVITTKDYVVKVDDVYADIITLVKSRHSGIIENSGYEFKTY